MLVTEKDLGEQGSLARECWARGVFVRWDDLAVPRAYALHMRVGVTDEAHDEVVDYCRTAEEVCTHMPASDAECVTPTGLRHRVCTRCPTVFITTAAADEKLCPRCQLHDCREIVRDLVGAYSGGDFELLERATREAQKP